MNSKLDPLYLRKPLGFRVGFNSSDLWGASIGMGFRSTVLWCRFFKRTVASLIHSVYILVLQLTASPAHRSRCSRRGNATETVLWSKTNSFCCQKQNRCYLRREIQRSTVKCLRWNHRFSPWSHHRLWMSVRPWCFKIYIAPLFNIFKRFHKKQYSYILC